MSAKIQRLRKFVYGAPLLLLAGCTGGSGQGSPGAGSGGSQLGAGAGGSPGSGASAGSGLGGAPNGGASNGGSGGGFTGGLPGLDPSSCAGPAPEQSFALSSGKAIAVPGPYIVLTGTLPPDITGSPVSAVEVQGSTRGVRMDEGHKTWSYFLAGPGGPITIAAKAESGSSATPLSGEITLGDSALPSRDMADGARSIGTWMFTWFTGDTSWECGSAWRPVGGFKSWDGSVAWARNQLLDQLDAHIDVVGLQLDTATGTGNQGYRFNNIVNVMKAARELLDEGVLPPRLFPFLDTAIIADHHQTTPGGALDLSGEAGRAYFYGHASAFYTAAEATFENTRLAAGVARYQDGRPAVGTWHSEAMTGVDNASVLDFKARFAADFGQQCYFIAHPNNWRDFAAVDEITQMVGPPTHFLKSGRDAGGFPTINLEAGFWNPVSNTFYLPREAGTHFGDAWQSAQAERAAARHIWIDTWNETGEGSGMFAADTLSYAASDTGPCGDFVNTHVEAWGAEGRHYIDVTRTQAAAWSDTPDLDAAPVASDLPDTMKVGERRYVTIVMRNTGDATWTAENHKLGVTVSSAARDFHIEEMVSAQRDALTERFGGVARGMPGVYTVLLTAPCTPGKQLLAFEIYDAQAGGFGSQLMKDIDILP